MPWLKRCCCCVTLRMGGITLGVTTLALSLLSSVVMILSFIGRAELAEVVVRLISRYRSGDPAPSDNMAFWGAVSKVFVAPDSDAEKDNRAPLSEGDRELADWLEDIMFVFFLACTILLIIYLVCAALLIYTSVRGRHRWAMMPWIVVTFLLLIAYLAGVCFTVFIFGGRLEAILLVVFAIVETAIGFYLWICIISLFQVLGSQEFRNGGGSSDWEMKPRFTTAYNSVPTRD